MSASEAQYRNSALPIQERVQDLLNRMTLEEKIAQVHCHGRVIEMQSKLLDASGKPVPEKIKTMFRNGIGQLGRPSQALPPYQAAEFTNAIQKYLLEETRLGIPALFNEEGLHGLMGIGATSFPQAIALSSTWDTDLVERVFSAVARETRARGSNYIYTPVLDLARDPRWGRVEETFGEDPYLVSRMGVAAIRGLQGTGDTIDKDHVIACAKHYAVHGQPEGGANAAPGNISTRIIREQFFPPFQAAVQEARVQAVMASYNEIDGLPAHTNPWLLQDVLRGEWGFEGFVTSDGFAVPQLVILHHVAEDMDTAARLAITAGIDCEVPEGICYPSLLDQVRSGKLPEAVLDQAVGRILRAKFILELFGKPQISDPGLAEAVSNNPNHRELALEAARKAVILLKNEGELLPLDPEAFKKIAVIGPNAANLHLGGYAADPLQGKTILDGLRAYLPDAVDVCYAQGCRITAGPQDWNAWHQDETRLSDPAEDDDRIAAAVHLAENSDLVILVIGGNEGTCREGWWFNHLGDRDSLDLLGRQEELALKIAATGKPVVAVLINGRPLTINSLVEEIPSILECWYPGQEGGQAIAEILFGAVNPSGKLTVTFPRSIGQIPAYYYQKPSARRGYLFTNQEPLFPFGFGLSYTSFEYANLELSSPEIKQGQTFTVSVTITNTGRVAGDEIVQLYIRDQVSTYTRPVMELKDFRRIRLTPGQKETIIFSIPSSKLAAIGADMKPQVEPGVFEIRVGASSTSYLSAELSVLD